ncbi:MAG: DUF433 domain-containing protein [Anaerolineae bacterium]|nr:DUF433 domain-containing protein [Anaerolineae bacterium]MCB9132423.1 DUF433 domain-containing protein [Anaerolineales bacterium]MCB0227732.1 DUF433 domain-containing protein [Anaerolineae bacterium]MCB0250706.1 DUF433 domain-containing protein [Anaerolineae bacterium]MCB9142290.1 DUF433 domain-containing protein [Anaerolineales bacterium]
MNTVELSEPTYELLRRQASQQSATPDHLAEVLLRQHLLPEHAYVEVVERTSGQRAVIKGTNIPVSIIVGYVLIGETPETIVENVMPHLSLAEVYDALSYYFERRAEIDQEIAENSETYGRAYLREHLSDESYKAITGQEP